MANDNIEVTRAVLADILKERERQNVLWGPQSHPLGTGSPMMKMSATRAKEACNQAAKMGMLSWFLILNEEFYEAVAEESDEAVEMELIQLSAVACAIVEDIRSRRSNEQGKEQPQGVRDGEGIEVQGPEDREVAGPGTGSAG